MRARIEYDRGETKTRLLYCHRHLKNSVTVSPSAFQKWLPPACIRSINLSGCHLCCCFFDLPQFVRVPFCIRVDGMEVPTAKTWRLHLDAAFKSKVITWARTDGNRAATRSSEEMCVRDSQTEAEYFWPQSFLKRFQWTKAGSVPRNRRAARRLCAWATSGRLHHATRTWQRSQRQDTLCCVYFSQL